MAEDLLTRIQRELQERMEALRGTVAEHDRLQADLRALDSEPAPPPEPEPPEKSRPEATVICFPARERVRTHAVSGQLARPMAAAPRPAPRPARERMVSPKVVRLMLAPRRPALERSGIARVTAHGALKRVAPIEVDELDVQGDRYEHAI